MIDVFASRPSARNEEQEQFWKTLNKKLEDRGIRPRTIGQSDYPNELPIRAVRQVMQECDGAIIMGFRQIRVKDGIEKEGTDRENQIENRYYGTPWNQIEAGMAYMLDLPMMIIREEGVEEGVFSENTSDRFIHRAEMTKEWLNSEAFKQPFNEWYREL